MTSGAFELLWPWLLLALPLPLLIPMQRVLRDPALRGPLLARWQALSADPHSAAGRSRRSVLLWLIWAAVLVAAARPIWVGPPVSLPYTGRDLMIAVDLSGSMRIEDMQQGGRMETRMETVRRVVTNFVDRRRGDRVGLILFGSQSYLQAPLTFDAETVARFMQEAQIGFAGPETAIGDAIGLAVKHLRDRPAENRVLILLTDGQDNASVVAPLTAADIAASFDIRIHAIGVGSDLMQVAGLFGMRTVDPSADLDEGVLMQIAERTGGQYFRARDPEELEEIYTLLDTLEPLAQDVGNYRPRLALSHWPLGVALLLSFLLALQQALRQRVAVSMR